MGVIKLNGFQTGTVNFEAVCEIYRTEYYKKERKEKREAAERYIRSRLDKEVDSLMKEIGIDDEAVDNLLNKKEGAVEYFVRVLSETTPITGISKNDITYFRMSCRKDADRQAAYNNLKDTLAYEYELKIAKETKLYPNTWNRFLDNEKGTTSGTIQKIEAVFNLNPEECKKLESIILKDTFKVSEELSDLSMTYIENKSKVNTGKEQVIRQDNINTLEDAYLTKSVLNTIETIGSNITQKTLLKLLIAFNINREASESYMGVAGSGFYRKLDVIFLSCIACGYTDPLVVSDIIDRFIKTKVGMTSLKNPYV